jgi:hypothetical protein
MNYLELFLIVVTAIIGFIGTASDMTHKENGKLTKAGLATIIMLGISLLATFVFTIDKQKKETDREKEQKDTFSSQNQKFKSIISDQSHIIEKANTTLSRLEKVILADSGISLTVNNNLEKTKKVNTNVIRTLTPLFPFAVTYSLNFHINHSEWADIGRAVSEIRFDSLGIANRRMLNEHRYSSQLAVLIDSLNQFIMNNKNEIKEMSHPGFDIVYNVEDPWFSDDSSISIYTGALEGKGYLITPHYRDFGKFRSLFIGINTIEICASTIPSDTVMTQNGKIIEPNGELIASVIPNEKNKINYNSNVLYNIDIYYFPEEKLFKINCFCDKIGLEKNTGYYKSSEDLRGCKLKFSWEAVSSDADLDAELIAFKFLLPPNYSNTLDVQIKDKGKANSAINIIL